MQYKMTVSENKIYLRCFKKFFLELLYFYWQLSPDNPVYIKLERAFKMSFEEYSSYISKKDMSFELMQELVDFIRDNLKMVVKSKVAVDTTKLKDISVEFELFSIGEPND